MLWPSPPGCPRPGHPRQRRPARPAGQRLPAGTHLLELHPGRHLLGDEGGLDAVEQPLQPADELGMGDPQLALARRLVLAERQRDPFEFLAQLGSQPFLQLDDRPLMDLAHPVPAGVVQRGGLDLLQQLLDHAADPHHLGRLLDQAGRILARSVVGLHRADRSAVRPDHHHRAGVPGAVPAGLVVLSSGACFGHGIHLYPADLLARPPARTPATKRATVGRCHSIPAPC